MVVVAFATFIVWFRMKGSWFKIGTTFSEGLGLGSLRSRDQALKGSERGRLSLSLASYGGKRLDVGTGGEALSKWE